MFRVVVHHANPEGILPAVTIISKVLHSNSYEEITCMKPSTKSRRRPYRALQLWQILLAKSANRQVATDGELERLVGYKGARVFAQTLGHIMYYCQQKGLPPLTALVVKNKTGLPGHLSGRLSSARATKSSGFPAWSLIEPTCASSGPSCFSGRSFLPHTPFHLNRHSSTSPGVALSIHNIHAAGMMSRH
jgi:hypothetical protein